MKRHLHILLLTLFFLPSLACGAFTTDSVQGSGIITTQTIDVSGFDRVSLEGMGNVFIEQGQNESLSIQTDENILPLLEINVQGNELVLGTRPNVDIHPSESIVYNLTVKDLSGISLSGSGDFMIEEITTDDLAVSISGSGDIDIESLTTDSLSIDLSGSGDISVGDLDARTITTDLSGSGDIRLQGDADTQEIQVDGSGNYRAEDLETSSAEIDMSGSADITIWVTDQLSVAGNGSGDIQYYGNPDTEQSGSGSIDVQSLGEK